MYHGDYRHFKENKLLEECRYKEGNRDGLYKRYYGDGQTVQSERTFIDGKVDGVSRTYHSNGKVETEKVYKLGIEDGYDRRYGSDGTLTLDECYKDGKRDGKWTQHLSSNLGDMVRISFYKNGLPDGQWSETWKDGKPRSKSSYKDGKKRVSGLNMVKAASLKSLPLTKTMKRTEKRLLISLTALLKSRQTTSMAN